MQPPSPFLKFQLLKGTVNTAMLFYFCCFAVWWWWRPRWCVEFIFTAFREQWHSHLLMYLIIAVLLFCIIVLSNLFKGPDMLWSFKYVPLGLEVVAIWWDSAAWQPFNNWRIQQRKKYDNCKCSVKSYAYHFDLSFSPWCQDDRSLQRSQVETDVGSIASDTLDMCWWFSVVFVCITSFSSESWIWLQKSLGAVPALRLTTGQQWFI